MKAALLARVSTEEQVEGYSLDAQRRGIQHARPRAWLDNLQRIHRRRKISTHR